MENPTVESVLKRLEKIEIDQGLGESPLLCIHSDYSGCVIGSLSRIELFSFYSMAGLLRQIRKYENGKRMIFTED
jgi:hypothetical protein